MPKITSRKLRTNLYGFSQAVNVVTTGRWILLTVLVGIFSGIAAMLFKFGLGFMETNLIQGWAGVHLPVPAGELGAGEHMPADPTGTLTLSNNWPLFLIPVLGGLAAGMLIYTLAPEAEGHGTDAVIEAYHKRGGLIKPSVPIVKLIASGFTIGSGGSAGGEGPIAQIGAGIGSFISKKLNLSTQERKILVMSGIGAGIGAVFKAPIGGALFASEVLYRKEMETEGLMASIIAAIVGYSVYASVGGWEPIFVFDAVSFNQPLELPFYILLAIFIIAAGYLNVKVFYGIKEKIFDRIKIKPHFKPAIGGLLIGMMAFFFPAIMGSSYGYLQLALNGHLAIGFMLLLAILKVLATSFTIQSGGSGGVFAPSLVTGGLLGGAFGYLAQQMFPDLITNPEGFVLVGMAAFFSSVAKVPIASTILITEMSASYGLIVPLIFASTIAYIGAQKGGIYRQQLEDRLASAAHRDHFLHDVLDNVKIRSAYDPIDNMPVLHRSDTTDKILEAFTDSETLVLPVKDKNEKLVGLISLFDVRSLINQEMMSVIIAADIMYPPKVLHLNDSFSKAFDLFLDTGFPEIPVLKPGSETEFVGTLSERNFLLTYEKCVREGVDKRETTHYGI